MILSFSKSNVAMNAWLPQASYLNLPLSYLWTHIRLSSASLLWFLIARPFFHTPWSWNVSTILLLILSYFTRLFVPWLYLLLASAWSWLCLLFRTYCSFLSIPFTPWLHVHFEIKLAVILIILCHPCCNLQKEWSQGPTLLMGNPGILHLIKRVDSSIQDNHGVVSGCTISIEIVRIF